MGPPDNDLLTLWMNDPPVSITPQTTSHLTFEWTNDGKLPMKPGTDDDSPQTEGNGEEEGGRIEGKEAGDEEETMDRIQAIRHTSRDFENGPWLDPQNQTYR